MRHLAVLVLVALVAGCTSPDETLETSAITIDGAGHATDAYWGAWSADPGARNVTSATTLRIDAGRPMIVRFTQPVFVGEDDPAWTVPIDGNVQLGWSRGEKDFTWVDGPSVRLPLSDLLPRAFVTYRIAEVPFPLKAQTYTAGYEVVRAP